MDINSLTPQYFEWVVKHMADMAIRLAHEPRPQGREMRWQTLFGGESRHRPRPAIRPAPADQDVNGSVTDAIAAYHDLLTDEVAAESQAPARRRSSGARACSSATGRSAPCCGRGSCRPRSTARCRPASPASCRAFGRAHEAALADAELRRQFGSGGLGGAAHRLRPRLRRAQPDLAARRVLPRRRGARASPSTTPRRRRAPATTTRSRRVLRAAGDAPVSPALRRAAAARAARRAPRPARRVRAVVRPRASRPSSRSSTGATCRPTASSCCSRTTSASRVCAA